MRLCTKQSANIRVTRRRSDLVSSPRPPPRGIEVLTKVVPYQRVSARPINGELVNSAAKVAKPVFSSTGQRNALVERFCWGTEGQRLSRPLVQLKSGPVQVRLRATRPFSVMTGQGGLSTEVRSEDTAEAR